MAFRSDAAVDFEPSPRIATFDAPPSELTIQDTHDTLRRIDADILNLEFDDLLDSSGGEDLGGGVSVGLTTQLSDAKIAFAVPKVWTSSGTVTGVDATGVTLTDSGATFVTDSVEPGAWLVNRTDGSMATVLRVDSETVLVTDGLGGGTDDQFDSADVYDILNITQVTVSGGNLVAVDNLGATTSPILPTVGTQILLASSSSATTQSQEQLEHSVFNSGVTIDVANITGNAVAGTAFPAGTPGSPCDNVADAITISSERGFLIFYIIGDVTFTAPTNISGCTIIGSSATRTTITLDPSAGVVNSEFHNATVQGTLDGGSTIQDCDILVLDFIDGQVTRCGLTGKVTLSGASTAEFIDCHSRPGKTAEIDMGGGGTALSVQGFNGRIEVSNHSGMHEVSLNVQGEVVLASTITNGTVEVTGRGKPITNNMTGAAVLDDAGWLDTTSISTAVWGKSTSLFTVGTVGEALAILSYEGAVNIDAVNGVSGTAVGVNGTPSNPVASLADAVTIAGATGIRSFNILNGTLTLTQSLTEWTVYGFDEAAVLFNGQSVNGSTFFNCTVKGVMSGTAAISGGLVEDVSNFSGLAKDSGISGTITLGVGESTFDRCHSREPGTARPTLDFVGLGRTANVRAYSGGLQIENMVDASNIATLEYVAGALGIDSSCTAGTLDVRGVLKPPTDNSLGTTVITTGMVTGAVTTNVDELHRLAGLDSANPMTANRSTGVVSAGDLTLNITGNDNERTLTRQP